MKYRHIQIIIFFIIFNLFFSFCKTVPSKVNPKIDKIISKLETLYANNNTNDLQYSNLYNQYKKLTRENPDYIKHSKNINRVLLFIDKLKTTKCHIVVNEPQEKIYASSGYTSPINIDFTCSKHLPYYIEIYSHELTFQSHVRQLKIISNQKKFIKQLKITSASFNQEKNIFYFKPHIYGENIVARLKKDMKIQSRKLFSFNIYGYKLNQIVTSATKIYEAVEEGNKEAVIHTGISIDNQQTKVAISASGQFTLGGNYNNKDFDILYGHPNSVQPNGIGTSFVTIQIDKKNYKLHLNESVLEEAENGVIIFKTTIKKEKVSIIQTLTPYPDKNIIKTIIQYTIINNSKKKKKIGLRLMLDTWAGKKDGVPFVVPMGTITKVQTHELDFSPTASIMWQTFDPHQAKETNSNDALLIHHIMSGDGLLAPNKIALVKWSDARKTKWSYSVNIEKKITGDSAILMWWMPVSIKPHNKLNIGTQLGAFIQKNRPQIVKTNPKEGIMLVHLWYQNNSFNKINLEYEINIENGSILPEASNLIKTKLNPQEIYFKTFNIQVNNEKDTNIKIIQIINQDKKIFVFPIKKRQTWNKLSVLPVAEPSSKIPVIYYNKKPLHLKARLKNSNGQTILSIDLIRKRWEKGYQYRGSFVAPSYSNGRYTIEVYK